MKRILLIFILFDFLACTTAQKPETNVPSYSQIEDIKLFLSTANERVESQVLDRLKLNDIKSTRVKLILQQMFQISNRKPIGLQPNLKFKMSGKTYSYALYVPESAKPNMPMIVVMHGMGGSGANIIQSWVKRLRDEFIIICPTYPMGAWWSKNAENLILKLIKEARQNYSIDPDRIFLSGLSNGAIGAYLIGMFYPDRFAGIVPIAGGITERYMHFLVNLNNTPTYMIQGEFDPIFPIKLARRIYKILSEMKSPVVYREHKERGAAHGGHFLPESEIPELIKWLKKQKRDPSPKVVRITREKNHMKRVFWTRVTRGLKLAALQIPGPEMEPLNIHDGKIATIFAIDKGDNRFKVMGKNVIEFEMYLSSDRIDFKQPVVVTFQSIKDEGKQFILGEKFVAFHQVIERDVGILLRGFKEFRDTGLLFDSKITVSAQKAVEFATLQ